MYVEIFFWTGYQRSQVLHSTPMDDFFGISIIALKKGIVMLHHPKNKWKLATDPARKFFLVPFLEEET